MRCRYNLCRSRPHRVPKQPFPDVCRVKVMILVQNCKATSQFSCAIQGKGAYAMRASFNRSDNTWASSAGGPGLNFGEHIAGRSRFGTTHK